MAKFLTYTASIIVLFALNMVMPSWYSAVPNFLFLMVVFYALRFDQPDFLMLAFFSGLLFDIFSGSSFGIYMVSLLIVALLVNYATRTFLSADPSVIYILAVVVVSYLVYVGIIYILNTLAFKLHFSQALISPIYFSMKVWIEVLLNLIFAGPIYWLTIVQDRIIKRYQPRSI